jgi:hypothetical protein
MARSHPIKRALTLALTIGAISPTAAAAMPPRPDPPAPSTTPAVQLIRFSAQGGFDWGDAGIGAAGGLGLSVLALGGGLVIAQRRGHRSQSTAREGVAITEPDTSRALMQADAR